MPCIVRSSGQCRGFSGRLGERPVPASATALINPRVSNMMCTYRFLMADGKPAPPVALTKASTFVFASSKVTTASAFSRLTSALVTPSILVNDLFTEIGHAGHVIPDTESVTVLISAEAAAETTANRINMAALTGFFTAFSFGKKVRSESPNDR